VRSRGGLTSGGYYDVSFTDRVAAEIGLSLTRVRALFSGSFLGL